MTEITRAAITAIDYFIPDRIVDNEELAREFGGDWDAAKIAAKTGIHLRHISGDGECASDLGVKAAERLFSANAITPEAIDFLLVCTQSPDFLLPPTACLMQDRLGLPTSVGALEFNLGCSGFIYGLSLAQGLIQSGQCRTVLLITAETYSKFIHPRDRSVRTLFGDGAAATLIQGIAGHEDYLGPFVLGTDGAGGQHLSVPSGGARMPRTPETAVEIEDPHGNIRSRDHLFMDGPEIFNFTIRAVPKMVHNLLEKTQRKLEDIDLFCFHQANQYMLEHLRNKLHIPSDRFLYYLAQVGNTVSSTIPITLTAARDRGALQPGMTIMLCGFGVGYSWGATLMRVP